MNYQRIYEYRFKDIDQQKREAVWSVIAAYIHRLMGSPEVILDPAGGRGEFLGALPHVRERWMVDAVKAADDALLHGVRFIESDIRTLELPAGYFDGIFVSNFFEHLKDQTEVYDLLVKFRDLLKPGGCVVIMGPNYKYCVDSYFDCADHITPLTDISMAELLYAAGYDLKLAVPRFLPFSFRSMLPANPLFTRLYLASPWLWRLAGRQFLMVARTPSGSAAGRDTHV